MWRQPKTVWSVAFACVIAFMGIGLVDPILKPIADELGAGPSQVSLLFTSYMAVMGVAMLGTGWVSSRIGAKRTLLLGLALIIVGAGPGRQPGHRRRDRRACAPCGASATPCSSRPPWRPSSAPRRGSVAQAIILYEAALGLGIATGPLLGGWLGGISWRWPFYRRRRPDGVALVATADRRCPATPAAEHADLDHRAAARPAPPRPAHRRHHRAALQLRLLHPAGLHAVPARTWARTRSGSIFFGWGAAARHHVGVRRPADAAPLRHAGRHRRRAARLRRRSSRPWRSGPTNKTVLVVGVVLAGAFLGVNNTLITETVMKVAPVERGVASAAYSFVRFAGGAVAPWLAGKLGEKSDPPAVLGRGRCGAGRCPCSSRPVAGSTATSTPSRPMARSSPHSRREAEVVAVADA